MGITVKMVGTGRLIRDLGRKRSRLDGVQRALAISAEQVRGEAARTLQQGPPRTGRPYTRGGRHAIRSAPGEPLKSDTGHLASHIFIRMGRRVAEIGTSVWYGKYWEEDVAASKRRPWLRPSYAKHKEAILRRIREAVNQAMKA